VSRDGRGAGAFATLLRYRGSASTELWRALRTLKTLQAEPAARPQPEASDPAPNPSPEAPKAPEARENAGQARGNRRAGRAGAAPRPDTMDPATPSEAAPASDAIRGRAPDARHAGPDRPDASPGIPIEPDGRANPGETTGFHARGRPLAQRHRPVAAPGAMTAPRSPSAGRSCAAGLD
jgi:hypothetical protein